MRKNIHRKSWPLRFALVSQICRTGVLLLCQCMVWFLPLRVAAQSEGQNEYQLKLAYLYKFAQFVQWPPEAFRDADAPLLFCIVGSDPFKGEMEDGVNGKKISGHPALVKQLKPDEDPSACHVVFVRAGQKKWSSKLVNSLKGGATLTVGETEGFAESGGLINLTLEDKKLRFEVNLDTATQSRLKVSAKLLALAKIVK